MSRSKRVEAAAILGLALFLLVSPSNAGSVISEDPEPIGQVAVIDDGPDPIGQAAAISDTPDPISEVTVIGDDPDPFSTETGKTKVPTPQARPGADVVEPSFRADGVMWCTAQSSPSVAGAVVVSCFDDGPWSIPVLMEITP